MYVISNPLNSVVEIGKFLFFILPKHVIFTDISLWNLDDCKCSPLPSKWIIINK